jgi:hypothetical protein
MLGIMPRGTSNPALLIAGVLTLLIALVHVVAIFISPAAFDYLDAAPLARMLEQGSVLPIVATAGVIGVLTVWGLFALSGTGVIRPLPGLRPALLMAGAVFTFRGLGVIWFTWLLLSGSLDSIPREIGFSLVSLGVGLLFLHGRRTLTAVTASTA